MHRFNEIIEGINEALPSSIDPIDKEYLLFLYTIHKNIFTELVILDNLFEEAIKAYYENPTFRRIVDLNMYHINRILKRKNKK